MILEQIDKELLAIAEESDSFLKDIYQNIDDICLHNSNRILSAFIENQVSYSDLRILMVTETMMKDVTR
mgnify:CR=1 FL=1